MLEAKVPFILGQFQSDYFCNTQKYPNWYGRIIAAVSADRAESSFFFLNLPGEHECAENLATRSWRVADYGPEFGVVWRSFWTAVTGAIGV